MIQNLIYCNVVEHRVYCLEPVIDHMDLVKKKILVDGSTLEFSGRSLNGQVLSFDSNPVTVNVCRFLCTV